MKKISFEITKTKVIVFIAAVIILVYAVTLFMPRDLAEIIELNGEVDGITTADYRGTAFKKGVEAVSMTEEDKEAFLNVIKETKIYKNPNYKKLNDGGFEKIGKTVEFIVPAGEDKPFEIYVFTKDILIIDGVQYRIYGKDFAAVFRNVTS